METKYYKNTNRFGYFIWGGITFMIFLCMLVVNDFTSNHMGTGFLFIWILASYLYKKKVSNITVPYYEKNLKAQEIELNFIHHHQYFHSPKHKKAYGEFIFRERVSCIITIFFIGTVLSTMVFISLNIQKNIFLFGMLAMVIGITYVIQLLYMKRYPNYNPDRLYHHTMTTKKFTTSENRIFFY